MLELPMAKYQDENVLVIKRALFDELGSFQGFLSHPDRYLEEILHPRHNFFMRRDLAESDPSHKQIIPYAVFRAGDRFLHYVRSPATGEKRLAAKGSIGIGGHVNDTDYASAGSLGRDLYLAGVDREIREEVALESSYRQVVVGMINDDETEVGQVHLGVVHLFDLDFPGAVSRDPGLTKLEFLSRDELLLRRESLESWSQYLVDSLDELLEATPSAML
jgi:predicted NUDIX family phosphoesterase